MSETVRKLKLKDIKTTGGTQMREELNDRTIAEYAEIYRDGGEMDPITVFLDGANNYWLVDGFHRVSAADNARCKTIKCRITRGTREEARWAACGVNKHGLHRTNEDKRKAVMAALSHPNGRGMSDRALAQHVGVSRSFVGSIRKQVSTDDTCGQPDSRIGRDGKTYSVPQKQTSNEPEDNPEFRDDWPPLGFNSDDPEPEPEDDRTLQEEEEEAGGDDWGADPDPVPEQEPEPVDPVKDFDAPVRQFVLKFSRFQEDFDLFAASNEYTRHFFAHHEREAFKGFLHRAKQVITANRPYAICGHCEGKGCEECGKTGVLPRNLHERIL